jgi:hypothetical protein
MMKEFLLPNWFSLCFIDSCSNLRIALISSSVCLYLALFVLRSIAQGKTRQLSLLPCQKEQGPNKRYRSNDLLVYHGVCIYLIAGSALIGALAFEPTLQNIHMAIACLWLAGLFLWLTLELLMPKNRNFDASVSYSRLIALPVSLSVIAWVCTGAKWF